MDRRISTDHHGGAYKGGVDHFISKLTANMVGNPFFGPPLSGLANMSYEGDNHGDDIEFFADPQVGLVRQFLN